VPGPIHLLDKYRKYRTNYDEEVQKYLMHILACLNQIRDELRKINKQEK
jgi:hypothetical protein